MSRKLRFDSYDDVDEMDFQPQYRGRPERKRDYGFDDKPQRARDRNRPRRHHAGHDV